MRLLLPLLPFLAARAAAACTPSPPAAVENVIAFGDSYTDEGRLSAYFARNGSAPEPGTHTSGSNSTASGGYAWGHFATQALGAKYYDYAVSGAFCSNEIFSRFLSGINRTFPSVLEDQIPGFLGDLGYVNASTGTNTFYPDRRADNTVYALWIGTNDLGRDAFLTDSQRAGLALPALPACFWAVFDALHASGARRFVLFQQAPLDRSPLYAAPEHGGAPASQYWRDKPATCNATAVEQKMLGNVASVNAMAATGAPFELRLRGRWPGASVTLFDTHRLLSDIMARPADYLDAPADAVGFYHRCNPNNNDECVDSSNPASSFLWYDELHPSERADEIIGAEFARVVAGNSTYATYW